jgi:hypothetical protein
LLLGHCWHDYLLIEVSGQRGDGHLVMSQVVSPTVLVSSVLL